MISSVWYLPPLQVHTPLSSPPSGLYSIVTPQRGFPPSLSPDLKLHSAVPTLFFVIRRHLILCRFQFFILSVSPGECHRHEGRACRLSCSLLDPQCLEQGLLLHVSVDLIGRMVTVPSMDCLSDIFIALSTYNLYSI